MVLLFALLPSTTCKARSIQCMLGDDPLPILHKFYQPGDVLIGEIVSQVLVFHNSPTFMEQPLQTLIGEPVYDSFPSRFNVSRVE